MINEEDVRMNTESSETMGDKNFDQFPLVELPVIPQRTVDIRDFGAVEGGFVSNTEAINAAIRAVSQAGGGRVRIPAGLWLTGPIRLLSRVELHTEAGTLVQFSYNPKEYPLIKTDYEGGSRIRAVSPISAMEESDIAITGKGVFDGGGQRWRPVKRFKTTDSQWAALLARGGISASIGGEEIWFPSQSSYDGFVNPDIRPEEEDSLLRAWKYYDYYRPVMTSLIRCKRVLIEDVTLQNSPAWNLHPLLCEHVTVKNALIRNPWYAQNGDGLDLESCRFAHIVDTCFDVGDDGICMKAGKNAPARKIPVPTEYVTIENCTVYHGHGGFVVGSEMSRGVRNIRVSNCTFLGTDVGIRFKSALGRGGVVEKILLENIRMSDIRDQAIIFTMGYTDNDAPAVEMDPDDVPEFRDIHIKDTVCRGCGQAIRIEGLKRLPIHDISFENVTISGREGLTCQYGERIALNNVTIYDGEGGQVLERYECRL